MDGGTLTADDVSADRITVRNGGFLSHFETTTHVTHGLSLNASTAMLFDASGGLSGSGGNAGYNGSVGTAVFEAR